MIGAIEETNRTWQPLSLPVRNEIAKRLDELDRENARLRMELDASCNAEELRQVRAENARLRDALNEARQYVEAYVLNVDAPGGVTGGESLLTKIDDILANVSRQRPLPAETDSENHNQRDSGQRFAGRHCSTFYFMTTDHLVNHPRELNIPAESGLDIVTAHARKLEETLRELHRVLSERHHGRMPEEVEKAYNAAGHILSNAVITDGSERSGETFGG
jgi:hypothetical protein